MDYRDDSYIKVAIAQMISLKKKNRTAINVESDIWESEGIGTAFVMGFFKTKIYIPTNIGTKEREYILLHERMHIRHGDHIVRIVMLIVNVVYWWNPLVWAAIYFMKKDMEMFCDESVVRNMETDRQGEYLRTLLNCSARNSGIVPVMSFGETNTEKRIRHIMNLKKPQLYIYILLIVFVIICYSGCIVRTDKPDSDVLSGLEIGKNTGSETDKETAVKENNTISADMEDNTMEEETLYEEWLAMNLPGWGRRMKYPADDDSDNVISVNADVAPDGGRN